MPLGLQEQALSARGPDCSQCPPASCSSQWSLILHLFSTYHWDPPLLFRSHVTSVPEPHISYCHKGISGGCCFGQGFCPGPLRLREVKMESPMPKFLGIREGLSCCLTLQEARRNETVIFLTSHFSPACASNPLCFYPCRNGTWVTRCDQ